MLWAEKISEKVGSAIMIEPSGVDVTPRGASLGGAARPSDCRRRKARLSPRLVVVRAIDLSGGLRWYPCRGSGFSAAPIEVPAGTVMRTDGLSDRNDLAPDSTAWLTRN